MNTRMEKPELSASLEDYLETIFFLSHEDGKARPKDIADRMNVRAASVTGALKALSEKGLVNYAPYASATLTDEGREVATKIAVKHEALLNFFEQVLGIEPAEAEEFACSMEHTIPDHILKRFVEFAEYAKNCVRFDASWMDNAEGYFCKAHGHKAGQCAQCKLKKK